MAGESVESVAASFLSQDITAKLFKIEFIDLYNY